MNRPVAIGSSQFYVGAQYGYIVVPSDVDRAKFIEQCYRWERVSIMIERGGGVIHECYITRAVLQDIEFPTASNNLGSCVLFLTDSQSGHPVIFGVLSKEDESQLLKEGVFKISKRYQGDSVTITGDAVKGVINLAVEGGSVSQLNISVNNTDKTGILNLRCQGNICFKMDGVLKINEGSEPMVKGTELKTQLDTTNQYIADLKDAIRAALLALDVVIPTSSNFDLALVDKAPGDYSEVASEESFLD
jgi:hypothetical protein